MYVIYVYVGCTDVNKRRANNRYQDYLSTEQKARTQIHILSLAFR
jgi:hypothetical protein